MSGAGGCREGMRPGAIALLEDALDGEHELRVVKAQAARRLAAVDRVAHGR